MATPRSKWKPVQIERDGELLTAYLLPPGTAGNTRYYALTCKKAGIERKSLKTESFAEAKERAVKWFKHEPVREERVAREAAVLTWDDWDKIQAAHFRKKTDQRRATKTLTECRKARRLFVEITKAKDATAVDADVVDRFQADCPTKVSRKGVPYSTTTVHKTMGHMSASFNRCCDTAGKKCVRGVVRRDQLLAVNPFTRVSWLEPTKATRRQFTHEELGRFFAWKWFADCPLVAAFAKASLWSCGRITEMTSLRWDWIDDEGYVTIPDDAAKWGKGRVVRFPPGLLAEIRTYRDGSPFVWAPYVEQVREYHRSAGRRSSADKLKGFSPSRLKGSFQQWIGKWAAAAGAEGLSHHAFRRTALQWSREGQVRNAEGQYAVAANVNQGVADKHYTRRPDALWADVIYRNLSGELTLIAGMASLLGLTDACEETAPTVDDVQAALSRNDLAEAGRLLALIRG